MKRSISALIIALLLISCSDLKRNDEINEGLIASTTELDGFKYLEKEASDKSKGQIATFLTFQESNAEEAMNFYLGLFENSRIIDVQRYGKEGPAKEGSIMFARFELNGSQFACSDSYIKHEWTFTPGVSIYVECKTEDEIQHLHDKLSENGNILMPLANYGWSTKFAFVEDQFGVSWQLNLN